MSKNSLFKNKNRLLVFVVLMLCVQYTFAATQLTVSAPTITLTKVYDGTTTAAVTAGTLSGVATADVANVTLNTTATYDNKNAGTGKKITVTYSLTGSAAAKYTAPVSTSVTTGVITKNALTVYLDWISDTFYDGTTTSGAVHSIHPDIQGDEVYLNYTSLYDDPNVGKNKKITVTCSLYGKDAANYTAVPATTILSGICMPYPLSVTAPTITLSKSYDGTTTAAVAAGTLSGVIPAEVANVTPHATATYDNANAGTGKTITVTYTLGGSAASNYAAPASTSVTTGVINPPKALTVSAPTITTTKIYDGTTTAAVAAGTLSGVAPADAANVKLNTTATYTTATVGTGKTITVTYTLSGSAAVSYIAPASTSVTTGVITAKALTAGSGSINTSKVFDGTNTATATTDVLNGLIPADVANVTWSTIATYDNANVGTNKNITLVYTLSGSAAANYIKPVNAIYSGTITAKTVTFAALTITPSKPYDGTTTAAVTAGALTGVLPADVGNVTLSVTGTYASSAVGTGKTITVAYTLSGSAAANYVAPATTTVTTGVITGKILTISTPTITLSKAYDGTSTAAVTAGTLTGVLAADVVNVTLNKTATYSSAAVGTGKTITVTYTLTGAAAANYTAPAGSSVTTGVITSKALTVAAPTITLTKPYDGTTTAAVTAGALTGVLAADVTNVMLNKTATYSSAAVGTGKTITVTYTLTGAAAANYTAPASSSVATGVITGKALTVAAPTITLTKPYDGTTTAAVTAGALTGVLAGDVANVTVTATGTYNTSAVGTGKTITVTYALTGTAAGNYAAPASSSVTTGIITATTKQLKVNVYLEGLWNGTSMNKTQAYDAVNDVLVDKFAGTIADTISVELHDMTSYATILYQAHGLELHQDGSITSAGLSYIEIPGSINGAYRITIKHRNHLEVASASSVSFSSPTVSYDFTVSSDKAFASDQTFTPTKLMNSKWMLYAGNIVAGDYPEINNDDLYRTFDKYSLGTGVYGYLPEDMNGDGFVDDTDFYMVLGNLLIYFYLP
jgi:hypothetical protein